jgi:hypothetical protein
MVNPDTGALFAQPLGVHTTLNPGLGGALPVPQSTIAANIAAATNDVQTVASAEYAKQQSLSRTSIYTSIPGRANFQGTCLSSSSSHASDYGSSA